VALFGSVCSALAKSYRELSVAFVRHDSKIKKSFLKKMADLVRSSTLAANDHQNGTFCFMTAK